MEKVIPKTIHYCWFGKNPLPKLARKCIASWKKYCPDYEIVEWNETNFDVNGCRYAAEAYEAKKWAFLSDYARYKILYEYGGVYLDTDVELIKPLDEVINFGNYMGCENYTCEKMCVNPGLGCATVAGNAFYAEMIEEYEHSGFKNQDGSYDLKTVVERTTDLLKKHGLKDALGIQKVCDITVYPAEYFSPRDMRDGKIRLTKNSYSVHHCCASWATKKSVFYAATLRFVYRIFGEKGFNRLRKIFGKDRKKQ